MSEHLYPTLVADGSLSTPEVDDCSTLHKQITSELDKYLHEAAEKCEQDDNYYDGWHVSTNTSNSQQEANFLEEDNDAGSAEGSTIQQYRSLMSKTLGHITTALLNTRDNPMMS